MTLLQVMPADDGANVLLRTEDITEIAAELAPYGIRMERWATVPLTDDAGQEQVLFISDKGMVSVEPASGKVLWQYDAPGQPPRPESRTPVRGLFLAGDWLDTGLPATIESAVRAGHRAAEMIIDD